MTTDAIPCPIPYYLARTPEEEGEHLPPDDEGADEGLEEEEVPPPAGPPEPEK